MVPLSQGVQNRDTVTLNVPVLRGFLIPERTEKERKGGDSDFGWMFEGDLVRFVSNAPTRTSVKFQALVQDQRMEGKQETAVAARTCTQTPEPSMFTECFKQRSQLCSNRNFPI